MPFLRCHALTVPSVALFVLMALTPIAIGCGEVPQPQKLKDHECGPQGARCPDEKPSQEEQDGTYPCGPQGAVCRMPKPKN